MSEVIKLTRKDFVSDQAVRWCPGCGDYAILAQIQKTLPELGIPKEKIVFISGIGCSSRFPYYMDTYGIHSIHGRAPTLATGLKLANPDLSVWVITGDGDGLSIGGNHLLHAMRRNVDLNIILFNNRIYGLTKGQYSPTSLRGHKTKSSPMGSVEHALNPLSVAVGAEASFVARTVDTNIKHMAVVLQRAAAHKGTSFVEVYQNCVIFNDKAWEHATDAKVKQEKTLELEHGKPLIFGKDRDKGIRLNGLTPEVVSLADVSEDELLVHDEYTPEPSLAYILSRMRQPDYPEPIGVFRSVETQVYEQGVLEQIDQAIEEKGKGSLSELYYGTDTWEVLPDSNGKNGQKKRMKTEDFAVVSPSEFDDEYDGVFFHGERGAESRPDHSLVTDTLADLNLKTPLTAHVDISLAEAVEKLQELNVGLLALVDDAGQLVGVFTEGDVFEKVACQVEDLSQKKVKDYMSVHVTAFRADTSIAYALHMMSVHQFRHVLTVDDAGKPVGVASFRSVVHYLGENFPVSKN